MAPPTPLQNIPTILEIQDFSEFMKNGHHKQPQQQEDGSSSFFETSSTSSAASHSSESTIPLMPLASSNAATNALRRLSFRLGSDAEESNYNSSSSQRTTPSFSTGNYIFDFDGAGAQSRSSSGYSTPSPKVLSTGPTSSGAMFLDIPREPFHSSFGPISNSHSSDKLVSAGAASNRSASLTPGGGAHPALHVSRSCSMLTKGVFGGGKSVRSGSSRARRRSSQTDHEEAHPRAGNTSDTSRKSSNSDASERSIFTRLIDRWQTHLHQHQHQHPNNNDRTVPAHALFLRYGSSRKSGKKSTRSHSETEAVEKSVKQRLKQMVRRNTDSVLKHQQQKSPRCAKTGAIAGGVSSSRPTPEDARSWQESFDTLLSSTYGTTLFRTFLQLEYNEENLAFYLACEKFKRLDPHGHRKITAKAQKIYDEFVRVEAPREVNLDSITRATTVTNLANPNRHCFDHAQRRVRHVLEKDVYPRFLKFDLYTQLLSAPSMETSPTAVQVPTSTTMLPSPAKVNLSSAVPVV
ncbi:putative Regulator of G-protein signaling 3 [Hypsibius exemplaris]|uniref:Regulator of G-protein signaling 3 n=1 Tax=Hypsibius exemplaris TaxID=2072580 RepID=A0A1W0XEH8_HYPEX|nr:putative Regulator of G-protein signaling 3 [Hypsibius exemplaris]